MTDDIRYKDLIAVVRGSGRESREPRAELRGSRELGDRKAQSQNRVEGV